MNELGVAEPTLVQRQGASRIVVNCPVFKTRLVLKRNPWCDSNAEFREVDSSADLAAAILVVPSW
ncbi:hypothetical protein OH492_24005 [Vibrio chagasii]|nr:hypothetical protein [Vibrio chagasii]